MNLWANWTFSTGSISASWMNGLLCWWMESVMHSSFIHSFINYFISFMLFVINCLNDWLTVCLSVFVTDFLPACLSTSLPVSLTDWLHLFLTTGICLPAFLPACLSVFLIGWLADCLSYWLASYLKELIINTLKKYAIVSKYTCCSYVWNCCQKICLSVWRQFKMLCIWYVVFLLFLLRQHHQR